MLARLCKASCLHQIRAVVGYAEPISHEKGAEITKEDHSSLIMSVLGGQAGSNRSPAEPLAFHVSNLKLEELTDLRSPGSFILDTYGKCPPVDAFVFADDNFAAVF